jgi:antitoxin PrlF
MAVATRLTTKGQVTIPRTIRERLGVGPGDTVDFAVGPTGTVEVRRAQAEADLRRAVADIRKRKPAGAMITDDYMKLIRDEP